MPRDESQEQDISLDLLLSFVNLSLAGALVLWYWILRVEDLDSPRSTMFMALALTLIGFFLSRFRLG